MDPSPETPGGTRAADLVDLFSNLVRLQIELWNGLDARLRREHDLPVSWFEAMGVIASRPGCRVQDVATTLVITIGGASKLVDRIEKAGRCRRIPDPGDGRSNRLELTSSGKRVLAQARRSVEDDLERRLGAILTDAQLRSFAATLSTSRAGLI